MGIIFHRNSMTFHLFNDKASYIFKIMEPGYAVHLYYGKRIRDRDSFDHLLEKEVRGMAVVIDDEHPDISLEHLKLEYPVYGTGDMRYPAIDLCQPGGSRLLDLRYEVHEIKEGKPELEGLPGVYTETDEEADTLTVYLKDKVTGICVKLLYSVMTRVPAIIRSAKIINYGASEVVLETVMSMSLDMPECDYDMIELTGAWARERTVRRFPLHEGIQSIGSLKGHSGNAFNPFIAIADKNCTETDGEVFGFSLVYSGNFLIEAGVDTFHTTRIRAGIHPHTFSWRLRPEYDFQSPEVVMVYADHGLNEMSGYYHRLYRHRLARGIWRDRTRPILVNNWEATYFDFDEEKLLDIAETAKELGIEMFVLDDGWFENRDDDHTGLGDWNVNRKKFPQGLGHFVDRLHDMGLMAGLWIEPEMVSPGTELYNKHMDWIIHDPKRPMHPGRHQYILDYSNPDVIDYIFAKLDSILSEAKPDYIKWDMNRAMSDIYSSTLEYQGELMHRYILGVYELYDRLTNRYPRILFESCSSGGARFDPGMLYYAPQCWTSDDTDAGERQKIQYGTSYVYPLSSMGSHVSAVPNHQLHRTISLKTRGNTAYFGTFGYELDLTKLTEEEKEEVKQQTAFMKEYRQLIQFGTFYRLRSPFETNETIWMVVSRDKKQAICAYYRSMQEVNVGYRRIKLQGLDPDILYTIDDKTYYGDELMNVGLILKDPKDIREDHISRLYILEGK